MHVFSFTLTIMEQKGFKWGGFMDYLYIAFILAGMFYV
jgi:Tfp pilus assembly major pilin PilA